MGYAADMVRLASALAIALAAAGLPVLARKQGWTRSHHLGARRDRLGLNGRAAAVRLREADILATAAGIPAGAGMGLRLGTPELVQRGATPRTCRRSPH